MRRISFAAFAALAIGIVTPRFVRAQDAVVPCKESACLIELDWGGGKTSASYPQDRRYGSGDDFDRMFRAALSARGFRLTETGAEGAMTIRLRPSMRERVMCDQVRGLKPDMTCTAMTSVQVSFTGGDPKVKAPNAIGLNNRCGASDVYLTMKAFAQYAADMVWWQLEGQAAKADRPVSKC